MAAADNPSSPALPTFPVGFVWGVASAAHQVEGGNTNNDWWAWEHNPESGCPASSGDACDSFHRWPEDIDLVAGLGLGAYRFSLEWSRIEPAEGEWSLAALDHYRRMCARCRSRGIEPVVTFHHFTTPQWLAGAAVGKRRTRPSASPDSSSARPRTSVTSSGVHVPSTSPTWWRCSATPWADTPRPEG